MGTVHLCSSEGKGTAITFSLPVAHVSQRFPLMSRDSQKFHEILKSLAQ